MSQSIAIIKQEISQALLNGATSVEINHLFDKLREAINKSRGENE